MRVICLLALFSPVAAATNVAHAETSATRYAQSIEALNLAYDAHPLPEILLSVAAVYEKWDGHCKEALDTYQRYFGACGACESLSRGVDRFDSAIQKCVDDIDAEIELRERFSVPRAKKPLRRKADASRREVVDVLSDARRIDRRAAGRLLVTFIELGHDVSVPKLNLLRSRGWDIQKRADADAGQVLQLVHRLKTVDNDEYNRLLGVLLKAERSNDQTKLNKLRQQAIALLTSRSSKMPDSPAPALGCRPNPDREWGYVTIATKPWTNAFVNGQAQGQTPVSKIEVLAGCVTIRAVNPVTGKEMVHNVTIRPNKNAIVQLDLDTGSSTLRYQ